MALKRVWIPSPNYSSRGGSGVRLVVVHTAEGARSFRDLGNFFASSSAGVSSHVGIDDERGSIGEYVSRANKSWTQSNFNPQAVSVELCAAPISSSAACGANWSADEWNKHDGMLANLADWIREECDHYGLPKEKISSGAAQGSGKGVCGHVDLGAGGGGHWDPGPNFPWNRVMDMVRGGSGGASTQEDEEMVASALSAAGNFHVFVASGKSVKYTWQKKGETSWEGGAPGRSIAGLKAFGNAPADIVGIDANLADNGTLHVFVKCSNGNTYFTYQPKGSNSWDGGEPGKAIAGFGLFAPK